MYKINYEFQNYSVNNKPFLQSTEVWVWHVYTANYKWPKLLTWAPTGGRRGSRLRRAPAAADMTSVSSTSAYSNHNLSSNLANW